ncbi:MAG: 2Fe-2S iron-sulfur cluster binding domain-containing protein [Bryobacterales bacterium]|nr:2Fe-2S iron-sulfur cluster binding domain-containing protein [Bryobacterales bacterium]
MEITLVTRDGERLRFPIAQSDVLAGAEAAGYFLPAMCHEGTCGQCQARVAKGSYEMGKHDPAMLPKSDPAAVLLCRCIPKEDLTVELPYNRAQVLHQKVPVRKAAITAMQPAWEGAVSLTLRLEPDAETGSAAEFAPGQYMELTPPGTDIRRAYSLANLPNWEGLLEFIIRIHKGGAFSTWLAEQAKVGDIMTVRGPLGAFVLDEMSTRPRCFVGGGCGLAPILSMLRHMGEFQDSNAVHLIFGANRECEIPPPAELESLRATLPQLNMSLAVVQPDEEWDGFHGTAPAALRQHLADSTEPVDVYACGPPRMLEVIEDLLRQRGRGDRLIAERI